MNSKRCISSSRDYVNEKLILEGCCYICKIFACLPNTGCPKFVSFANFKYIFYSNNAVPGKPPTNMSVEAINPTSLLVKWKFPLPSYKPLIPNKALRIFYELHGYTTVQDIKDTNVTAGFHALDELKKFSWYTVWVKSATSRGLGVESERFKVRTLEEGMLGGWERLLGSLQHCLF